MTQKQNLRLTLVFGLFFLSLGGWLLHLWVHTPSASAHNYLPFIIGVVNFAVIPWMFLFRRTLTLAYVLNGMSVIIGIILMAHLANPEFLKANAIDIKTIFLSTTLADIFLLCGKFTAGKVIFDLEFTQLDKELPVKFKFFRYPNLGWWVVHLVTIGAVYFLGVAIFGK